MTDRWFAAFRREPDQAVADLVSGRAGVGSNLRLDVPELLYQAFPPNLANERTQLDDALWSWLLRMRESYADQVKRLGFPVYGKRVGDVLIALQLLELPAARHRIRADLDAWLRWLAPLRLAPERDPALECLRLLTRGQPDARHTALWLRHAADPRPEYLTVALAGLQRLPNRNNAQTNQMLMLQALLRHAVRARHEAGAARAFFNRRFAAVRGLFPRGPQHWKRVLGEALKGFREHTKDQVAIELADTLSERWLVEHRRSSPVGTPEPGTKEQWSGLLADILNRAHRPEPLAQRLFEQLEQRHRYAEATGVSHFFVRTLHNLGSQLLKQHQLGEADMNRFGLMIERALVWEPMNPFCWMLWADWFQAQGHRDGHESTLREMLRLFPSDVPARVELGRLLITRGDGHWNEAAHWLLQAMKLAPESGHAQVVMARLLVMRDRRAEAEAILAKFLARHPDNRTAQQALDQLRAGGHGAAEVFAESGEHSAQDPIDGGAPPAPLLPGVLNELVRRGSLAGEFSRARIAGAHGWVAATGLIKQEAMKGDPLAGFYSQWLMPNETPACPPHAWSWNACRHWQESAPPDRWRDLAAQFPEAAPETEFLRVLAAPEDNQAGAAKWRARYDTAATAASRAVDVFLREAQERLVAADRSQRDDLAAAVMACAAADAPELGLERAALSSE